MNKPVLLGKFIRVNQPLSQSTSSPRHGTLRDMDSSIIIPKNRILTIQTLNRRPLDALIIYESILACLMADMMCKRIANHNGNPVNGRWCSLPKVRNKNHHSFLDSQVEESDIILFAKTSPAALTGPSVTWLTSLRERLGETSIPVLGIFALCDGDNLPDLRSFRSLQACTSDLEMPFYGASFPLDRSKFDEPLRDFELLPLEQEFADFLARSQNLSASASR
jgi:hypothetical protein